MNERATWVRITTCRSILEAEISIQALDAAGIPGVARGHDLVGVFGPGFQGNVPRGVDLLVPSPMAEEAREVLGLDEPNEPTAA